MLKNILRISVISISCLLISCSASKNGGAASAVNNSSTNMGTTNTGNALQPLELISGPGAAPVTGSDGNLMSSTVKLIASYAAQYDPSVGAGICLEADYSGQSYCMSSACALQNDPNLLILNPQTGAPYNMCVRDACLTDASELGGTVSIASDASTNAAPSAQCVTNGYVYFLKITVFANYDREYFVDPTPQPMTSPASNFSSCIARMLHFTVSSFVDLGATTSPPDTNDGFVDFFCAEYPADPTQGSFVIRYCEDSASCATN